MCILNCCKVINNLLLNISIVSDENPPGADDFLPVLIYVTIKASSFSAHKYSINLNAHATCINFFLVIVVHTV